MATIILTLLLVVILMITIVMMIPKWTHCHLQTPFFCDLIVFDWIVAGFKYWV
jgi:hypothetical protein